MEPSEMEIVVTPAKIPEPAPGGQEHAEPQYPTVPDEHPPPDPALRAQPMNSHEAVSGFVAWLTAHETPHVFATTSDAGHAALLVGAFAEANELPECRDHWEDGLVMPPLEKGNGAGAGHDLDALAEFLMWEFGSDFGGSSAEPSEGAVTMAKRLLGELKTRRSVAVRTKTAAAEDVAARAEDDRERRS